MPERNEKKDIVLMFVYGGLMVLGLVLTVMGVFDWAYKMSQAFLIAGIGLLAIAATLYPIASSLLIIQDRGKPSREMMDLLHSINDRLLISDTAKRIAYRETDRDALRKAIREDINKRDFDAALALVVEMTQTYGYRQEAETFRQEILAARKAEQDAQVAEAIARFDEILARREWERASAEADRVSRLFPDHEKTRGLAVRVREARTQHKLDLERALVDAAHHDDLDRAVEIMKELDRYLTPAEAEPFREIARGVFGKKRDNLGVQLKIAIHDKEYPQAVRICEQLIREFPNSKMADEARAMIDRLRELAANQRAAAAAAGNM